MKRFSACIWHHACFDPITLVVGSAIAAGGALASGMMGGNSSDQGSAAQASPAPTPTPAPTPVTPPAAPAMPQELAQATNPSGNAGATTPTNTPLTPTPQATLPTPDATSLTNLAANKRAQANAANQAGRTSTILTNFSSNSLGGNRSMGSGAGTSDYSKRTLGAG